MTERARVCAVMSVKWAAASLAAASLIDQEVEALSSSKPPLVMRTGRLSLCSLWDAQCRSPLCTSLLGVFGGPAASIMQSGSGIAFIESGSVGALADREPQVLCGCACRWHARSCAWHRELTSGSLGDLAEHKQ